ncbi:hypothetical protein [Tuberibacillus calidus]|jgi:hypothetical protein|uniref:hypothetical protein n=1 Tax=Tuberibacillus calidus TaxID=340097 RepID=UPI000414C022|nr:hypothetical protein [Tuberibacillus calidus]
MKQVIQTLKRTDAEKRIPVLRMEIDYELLTLYDAMESNNIEQIEQCKQRLEKLRQELLRLEV